MLLQLLHEETITSAIIFVFRTGIVLCFLFLPFAFVASWLLTPAPPEGLRRLGLIKPSGLSDQYDAKYTIEENSPDKGELSVKALYIYPIKSCNSIELSRALLTKTGFAFDRCFTFATEEKDADSDQPPYWRMISQRTKPQMSLINVEIWLPREDSFDPLTSVGGCLIVTFPDPGEPNFVNRVQSFLTTWSWSERPRVRFTVPLMPTSDQIAQYGIKQKPFNLHSRIAQGLDLCTVPEVAAILPKLKKFLKVSPKQGLTLFRCTSETLHPTTLNLAPLEHIGKRALHGYTDQQPVHILNVSSVHAVSKLVPRENRPLNALRFRANLYFIGAPAYDEEEWKRIQLRSATATTTTTSSSSLPSTTESSQENQISPRLSIVCRTSRCTMPNVIPESGVFEHENPPAESTKKRGKPQPSTTLIEHRTVEDGNKAALGYLGMHCVPEDDSLINMPEKKINTEKEQGNNVGEVGVYVSVGDVIEVLERGVHLYGSTGDDY